MPFESVLFLALVIGALSVFAAALFYAEWTTRNLIPDSVAAVMLPSASVAKKLSAHSATSARVHEIAA
jgi:hypothetical protein